ncbi:Major facilitator superfamily domain, general substrate transporter [Metarhizium album ARSEF 1941]|uniref:Major facilitator superfamily domain, general substrate transporter n=1 Tax=Metarhizium album (strain ARSEF 1941) TaxID=1081103 RepID=A0A0B2WV90_METAS|nr:Major facilitator superfamily domain, general substrate transporter [Metarhizium album ARSEF 1941]KHN97993.1 Major facilitator superfamily domain, general substrate transporter [Metarhizium album ARSEF 1941]
MAHAGRRSPFNPGEASPSFAQTGAGFTLDGSDDDAVADAYEMVEPHGGHERRHRRTSASTLASFQPYTPDEELAVRRKFDRKLVLFVAFLFMLSFLDRSNIGSARIAGMDEDLQTTPPRDDWYEWALSAFYMSYVAFEWMSLLFKLVPAHIVVSMTVLTWGLTASLQAVAPSYPVLIALRVLLGIGEAGFTGIPFYLSFFFKREELAFRTAMFISGTLTRPCSPNTTAANGQKKPPQNKTAAPLATSFASTLAYIIVKFASRSPIAPWRLLFLLEGLPSVLAAVAAFTTIPDSPSSAPYLTDREKKVARLRLRPRPRAGHRPPSRRSRHTPASGLKPRDLLLVLADPVAWLTSAMFFLANMAYSSLPVFLPKIMTEMGHDALTSQALCAPPYLVAFAAVLITAHMSDRLRARTIPIVLHASASAAGYAALALAGPLRLPPFLRYLAVYPAAVGFFNVVTLIIAWSINNQASQTRQGGGFAILQLVGQCGPLVGTRLYPDSDAPYYTAGMGACALSMLAVAVLALFLRCHLQHRNSTLDRKDADRGLDDSTVEEEALVASERRETDPAYFFRYML